MKTFPFVLIFREFCWKRQDSENGFMIPWDKVTVQAITQEPSRCVYFMIDVSWPDDPASNQNGEANGNHVNENNEGQEGSEDEGNDSEGSIQELTEFHIMPDAADAVDEIYFIMSKFPATNPMDDESDDDDFFDGENIENMNIQDDDQQDDDVRFADAE